MRHFGLIGRKLDHSWSAKYFTAKFAAEGIDADYKLFELENAAEAPHLPLDGYNVTIPYKTIILPYLQELDPIAAEINAVNVVKNGKGYNTDWIGFKQSLQEVLEKQDINLANALILGQGGVAKAVCYALRMMNVATRTINAREKIELDLRQFDFIVNATPLGMWPNTETFPDMDYSLIGGKQVLFDCVYNPEETEFLRRGKAQGAVTVNGQRMLVIQAEESWKIFNS